MGMRFHVGAAFPFLGVPLHELRNQRSVLHALEQRDLLHLWARMQETQLPAARIGLLEE